MSFLNVAPDSVLTAAGELSGIGVAIEEAGGAAAAPITTVLPPAADEVSAQIATLFNGHAQTYQAASTQGALYHQDFVRTFTAAGASYANTEAGNVAPLKAIGNSLFSSSHRSLSRQGNLGIDGLHLADAGKGTLRELGSTGLTRGNALAKPTAGLGAQKNGFPRMLGSGGRFPVLHQILQNQINYVKQLVAALKAGDPLNILMTCNAIIQQVETNFGAIIHEITNFGISVTGDFLKVGAPFALMLDLLGAPIVTLQSLESSVKLFVQAIESGNILGALGTLVKAPFNAVQAFFVGQGVLDYTLKKLGGLEMHIPIGGLFAPLRPAELNIFGQWKPLNGTQFGGLFAGMKDEIRQIAQLITPPGSNAMPPAVPRLIAPPTDVAPLALVRPLDTDAMGYVPNGRVA
jgi:PE family